MDHDGSVAGQLSTRSIKTSALYWRWSFFVVRLAGITPSGHLPQTRSRTMPDFTIRPATHADAEMLGHIGVATFVESYTDEIEGAAMMAHCSSQHSASTYKAYLGAGNTGCWLTEHAKTGAPMGYALNCTPDLPIDFDETDIELKRIYVLSKYHGQGIAGALLQEAFAHAATIGAKRILLGTYKDNHRALAFYAKHGFKLIGTRKFNIGGRLYDDVILAKSIR